MILKIFSPKKLALLIQNKVKLGKQNFDHNIGF
jgi:hypothetical protein